MYRFSYGETSSDTGNLVKHFHETLLSKLSDSKIFRRHRRLPAVHGFRERGCILEHQIFGYTEMIMRDRSSTSYDLATLFRARLSSSDSWIGKIAKRIGTRASALHSYLHFEGMLAELLPL